MTSGGNYPPDPYAGSHGYPPEGDDSSEQHRRDDYRAYGPDPSERDASGSPVSASPAAPPAVARAAINMPGLRTEPPVDGQAVPGGPGPAGQVYGRPSATTYGRPVSPGPAAEPEPPARGGPDARDFPIPGQPRVYGQPQRHRPIEPDDEPVDSHAYPNARGAVPGQREHERNDSWASDHDDVSAWQQPSDAPAWGQRNDPSSWEQRNDAPAWDQQDDAPAREQQSDTPAWERQSDAPAWEQGSGTPAWERDDDSPPADRTPGLYGQAAATSSPAPQPLYGGAPSADANGNGFPTKPAAAFDDGNDAEPPRPSAADGADRNRHADFTQGANGPSANAFGPGVYGASVYGAATYGTPRDPGNQDDPVPPRHGSDAESGRDGFAGGGEIRYGMARPSGPAAAEGPHGSGGYDYGHPINGSQVNNNLVNGSQVNNSQINGSQINGRHVDGSQHDGVATPEAPPARPGGQVYGTPRVYGSPRPTPDDDAGDSPAGFDDRRDANRPDDRHERNGFAGSPGSAGDTPRRSFGAVPGRAVADMPGRPGAADMPGRPGAGDGIGRFGDAMMDRTQAGDPIPRQALGRPASAWPDQARPERNSVPPAAPTSPSATRVGQTYGSSRPPIDWNVPEQDNRAGFDNRLAPGDGVRIPSGTSSFSSPASLGTGNGSGASVGSDSGSSPEPRRWARTAGIVAIVVIVIGLAAGALYYTSRPNAPSYKIGSCVQHTGENVNAAACTAPNSYKIVSKVSDPSACPNSKDPYLYLGNDRSQVYCLSPNQ